MTRPINTDPRVTDARFWSRVDRSAGLFGCWVWSGGTTGRGYGHFYIGGGRAVHEQEDAHRYAYRTIVGPVPAEFQLDHLCRNRRCVNPTHLEPVTAAENVHRSASATKTHCVNGHAFNQDNTYRRTPTQRTCRRCHAETESRRRERVRAAA